MGDTTARLGLPMIRAGQAQKESSHNEALAGIDLLLHATAVSIGLNTPPATPAMGQVWIVGAAPGGGWAGHAKQLAGWTEGGWRFIPPVEGMTVWLTEALVLARYSTGFWTMGELIGNRVRLEGLRVVGPREAAVADPAGGSVVDVEARAALMALLDRLRGHGLIAY